MEMVRVALELLASVGFTLSEFKSGWWDEINESTQWQDGIFFALCAAYAVVAVVALVCIHFLAPSPHLLLVLGLLLWV